MQGPSFPNIHTADIRAAAAAATLSRLTRPLMPKPQSSDHYKTHASLKTADRRMEPEQLPSASRDPFERAVSPLDPGFDSTAEIASGGLFVAAAFAPSSASVTAQEIPAPSPITVVFKVSRMPKAGAVVHDVFAVSCFGTRQHEKNENHLRHLGHCRSPVNQAMSPRFNKSARAAACIRTQTSC
jgi:hypothetical protein